MKNLKKYALALLLLMASPLIIAATDKHADSDAHTDHDEHGEEGAVRLSAEERAAQGIRTAPAILQALTGTIIAPGEVRVNAYRSTQVTPRISAQIVARHVRLGESVQEGQRLVTLSSVDMAEAQGELLEADREWRRVRQLGSQVVAEKRYLAAEVERQRAYATVAAYGMTDKQITALLGGDATRASGTFDLLSPQDGTVISDEFVVGELAEPGRVLFDISDESVLWVETRLSPQDAARVTAGTEARIAPDDGARIEGKVIQVHHRLDETTRTQALRIEVDNRDHRLHPGQFVQVSVPIGGAAQVLAVPNEALVLMQGAPTLFRVEGDTLHPQPVETGVSRGGYTEIKAGLNAGDEIVIQGVFLLKSMLLKSEMGEGHAH